MWHVLQVPIIVETVIHMSLTNALKEKQLHFHFFLGITLNYIPDLKIMFQCLLHLNHAHVGMAES